MAEFDSITPDRTHGDGFAAELDGGAIAIFSHGKRPMSLFTADGRIVEVNDAWVEKDSSQRGISVLVVEDEQRLADVARSRARSAPKLQIFR